MMIYLEHPLHGRKIAYDEREAVQDEKNGWMKYDPEVKSVPRDPYFAAQLEEETIEPVKRRPGRPKKVQP